MILLGLVLLCAIVAVTLAIVAARSPVRRSWAFYGAMVAYTCALVVSSVIVALMSMLRGLAGP